MLRELLKDGAHDGNALDMLLQIERWQEKITERLIQLKGDEQDE